MTTTLPSRQDKSSPAAPPRRVGRPLSRAARARKDRLFVAVCVCAAVFSVVVLLVLLGSILWAGAGRLSWQFLSGVPSRFADQAGILPAMAGTMAVCLVCVVTAVPIGVATAILLEEYKPSNPLLRRLHGLVQINITNLAGVPSIVYGILGLTVFVHFFGLIGNQQSPAFEFGVRYYDRFTTVDGKVAYVPVASADAPVTRLSPGLRFTDEAGKPLAVTLLDASRLGDEMRKAEDQIDAFEERLEDRIDALRLLAGDPAALGAELQGEWAAGGMAGRLDALAPTFADDFARAVALPGREGKKALRTTVKQLGRSLAAAQHPGGLLDDATASRSQRPSPWYLRVPFGRSVLAGGLTLMLVVLPIIIISTQESLRAVGSSMRQASLALGATKWQTIWNVTLPGALPGMMTGVILAMSRAIGEAAPILIIAGIVYITFTPRHLMDDFTAMPLQIYQWAGLPQSEFHSVAAAGILVLLAILLAFNLVAIVIRQRAQRARG